MVGWNDFLPLLLPRNFCSSQVGQFTSPWMCCKHSHHRENLLLLIVFSHPTVGLYFFQVRPSSEIPLMASCLWTVPALSSLSLSWVPAILAKPSHLVFPLSDRYAYHPCLCLPSLDLHRDGVPGWRRSRLVLRRNITSPWALHPECGQLGTDWRQFRWSLVGLLLNGNVSSCQEFQ